MTGHLRVNKKGWNQLKRRLESFGHQRSVDVGFFKESKYGPQNDRLQVAQVAAWNDLGSRTNPPRPFLTVNYSRYVSVLGPTFAKRVFMMALTENPTSINNYLNELAKDLSETLQGIILDYPGRNSDDWAAIKGFNDPLIHTGKMYDSVAYRVRKDSKIIKRGKP